MSDWKNVPINECGEKLTALGPFSLYPDLRGSAIYAGERTDSPYPKGLDGSLLTHFVRESVAERLRWVNRRLPVGTALFAWDGYRDVRTQKALFAAYAERLRRERPGLSTEAIYCETQKLVAAPSHDPMKPSPHNTGGSVDLTMVRLPMSRWLEYKLISALLVTMQRRAPHHETSVWLLLNLRLSDIFHKHSTLVPMGTLFDEDRPETAASYYNRFRAHNAYDSACKTNRFLFHQILDRARFSIYEHEWWHADCGNQMHACRAGFQCARYGATVLSPENIQHELMRRLYYSFGMSVCGLHVRNWSKCYYPTGLEVDSKKIKFMINWVRHFSPPNITKHPMAATL